ncbi:hypothetical protein OH77DRAFT_1430539 [Trametes cingulata]|nr:hypothetical protein OH77DRAFT_1430539 [Trametes cingulata]
METAGICTRRRRLQVHPAGGTLHPLSSTATPAISITSPTPKPVTMLPLPPSNSDALPVALPPCPLFKLSARSPRSPSHSGTSESFNEAVPHVDSQ